MIVRRAVPWIFATLLVAIIVHAIALYAIPRIVMARVTAQMGTPNTMHQGKRPDASSRGVVRPSTDLLYSICPYDLSKGLPLLVTAAMPYNTYWSVSVYDADTNNYFVRDDRQQRGKLKLTIYPPSTKLTVRESGAIVSPTRHGIVIFRTLVDSEAHLAALESGSRTTKCSLWR